jgi:hypothetical protein
MCSPSGKTKCVFFSFLDRNDEKLILTCMGALNDDSSVVLWNSEKHEVNVYVHLFYKHKY